MGKLPWIEIFKQLKCLVRTIEQEPDKDCILVSKECDSLWLILLNMFGGADIGTSGDSILYHAMRLCDSYYHKEDSYLKRIILNPTSLYSIVVYSCNTKDEEPIVHCIPMSDYCTCKYFLKAVQKDSQPICSHLLAAHLIELSSF